MDYLKSRESYTISITGKLENETSFNELKETELVSFSIQKFSSDIDREDQVLYLTNFTIVENQDKLTALSLYL